MTSSQIPSRIAMPCPFGGFGSNNITPIKTVTGTDVNFPDGFPSAYGAPTDTSGKFVTRKEMNAIGNLASNDLFYHKCGGLNTFDAEFCAQIGGYPKGAVLELLVGNDLRRVISLTDNNKVCFSGDTISSSQSQMGIVSGSVDNINWRYLDKEFAVGVFYSSEFWCEGGYSLINVFEAPTNGILEINIENNNVSSKSRVIGSSQTGLFNRISNNIKKSCVIINDVTSSSKIIYPKWQYSIPSSSNNWLSNNWEIAYGDVLGTSIYYSSSSSTSAVTLYGQLDISKLSIVAGHRYAIAVGAGEYIGTYAPEGSSVFNIEQVTYSFSGKISLGIK